jgi:hypothetical protein
MKSKYCSIHATQLIDQLIVMKWPQEKNVEVAGISVIRSGWHLRWLVSQMAGVYNTAVAHLVKEENLVNPKAPALSKVAANPLLFTDNVTIK